MQDAIPMHPMDMTGRRILVTGASAGIGRATSVLLSRLGAAVALTSRHEERLQATLADLGGTGHRLFPRDLTARDDLPAWLRSVAETFGPLDGLVHCAGVHRIAPLRFLEPSVLDETLNLNARAALWLVKGFRQPGVHGAGGSVVLVSSIMGLVGQPGLSAYAASKGAVVALGRSLAAELAGDRIRVNCVAPGYVRTPMTERLHETLSPEQIAAIEALHPLGVGAPEDVANAIAFLLADTGRWITGSVLVVDGGYTAV